MSTINLHNYEAFLLDYSEGKLNAEHIAQLKTFLFSHPELEIDLVDFDLPYLNHENDVADFKESLKRKDEELADEELLSYLEGQLSPEKRIAFENRLLNNKDLASQLAAYKQTALHADLGESAAFKQDLIRTDDDLVLNNRLIAYLENQLTLNQKTEFETELLTNIALQKDFRLISQTVLFADPAVGFPDKESLKKENKVIVLFSLRRVGSVAAAILLLFGFALIYSYFSSTGNIKKTEVAVNKKRPGVIETPVTLQEPVVRVGSNDKTISLPVKSEKIFANKQIGHMQKVKEEVGVPNPDIQPETTSPEIVKKEQIKVHPDKLREAEVSVDGTEKEVASFEKSDTSDSSITRHNYLLLAEEVESREELTGKDIKKQGGFWKRAVQVAKQANKLGVKSVDGQENSENRYRLSFNSFSVEKK